MEKLTREEFDGLYEAYMNGYRLLIHHSVYPTEKIIEQYQISLMVNPRGHFLVGKGYDQLYLGTSQEAAISAYNKALEEVENVK